MTFYRLLTGKHLGPGPRDCDCSVCVNNRSELEKASELKNQNPPYNPRLRDHVYRPGDIVESDLDLLSFNKGPRSMRFEVVDSVGRPVSQTVRSKKNNPAPAEEIFVGDGLDGMTISELRKFAEEEEIDLGSAVRKDEILKEIRKQMVQSSVEAGFRS